MAMIAMTALSENPDGTLDEVVDRVKFRWDSRKVDSFVSGQGALGGGTSHLDGNS